MKLIFFNSRRFKDFVELNSQVKQNLKGNHLRWALPPIPEKPLKAMTDHRDPAFIQDRAAKLEIFISALVSVPHVSDMICVKAFVGIMEQVREFSLSFHVPTIGMSLLPSDRLGDNTPAIVGERIAHTLNNGSTHSLPLNFLLYFNRSDPKARYLQRRAAWRQHLED